MIDQYLHAYEKVSLGTAGVLMGLALLAVHGFALAKPRFCKEWLVHAHRNAKAAKILIGIDFAWLLLLLLDVAWNPLRMNLYDFNRIRPALIICSIVIWAVLHRQAKDLLFPRALGFFLLLAACVPLTAAFLKEPVTRLLIPIWWYPALTIGMVWVGMPYLFRDWAAWLAKRPLSYTTLNMAGLAYGLAVAACAIAFWH